MKNYILITILLAFCVSLTAASTANSFDNPFTVEIVKHDCEFEYAVADAPCVSYEMTSSEIPIALSEDEAGIETFVLTAIAPEKPDILLSCTYNTFTNNSSNLSETAFCATTYLKHNGANGNASTITKTSYTDESSPGLALAPDERLKPWLLA